MGTNSSRYPSTPTTPSTPSPPNTDADAPPSPAAGGRILDRPLSDVRSAYTFGRELGRGQFGIIHLVTHRDTRREFACKSIAKRKLVNRDDADDVRREVQIMHHLTGHRNIVELREVFEDRNYVHLVMDLCAGGELFDRIIAKGHYSKRAAAALCRQIVTVVHACHSMGVMHRDLKPENFLFSGTEEDSPLKATDFGLSVFFKPAAARDGGWSPVHYVSGGSTRRDCTDERRCVQGRSVYYFDPVMPARHGAD